MDVHILDFIDSGSNYHQILATLKVLQQQVWPPSPRYQKNHVEQQGRVGMDS